MAWYRCMGGSGGSAVLVTKTITGNGTYNASDDNADGYSQVTVDVEGGTQPFGYKNSETDAEYLMEVITT